MQNQFTTVICAVNSKYIHSSLAPWCLLAGVKKYGIPEITARIVEGTINEPIEKVAQRITANNPQVIGLCCYIWNITAVKQLIPLIKSEQPDTIIVLGGPEVSYNAQNVLEELPVVDYVLSGEGEKPFAELLNALYSHTDTLDSIAGLCFRKSNTFVISPPNTPEEIPPTPYTDDYFKSLNGRIAYLETSRGCPFTCAFCLSGRCGNVRYYDMDRAKNELLLLANSGTQTVKLVDRTFNANRSRANELFQFILDNYGTKIPKGVCFHFEIAGDILNDETLNLLARAPVGSIQLEIGLQSFNSKTLTAIHRKTNVDRLKNNIQKLVSSANIHVHIDLIAGLPFEDLSSFEQSFNTAYYLKPNMLQLGFLKLLYGAPMREHPEQYPCSYSECPPYEVIHTPWLTTSQIDSLHHTEDALERLYNSGRFRRTITYVLNQTCMTPFQLFYAFGEYAANIGVANISLNEYTGLVFTYLRGLDSIDQDVLRDTLVCDRLATNSSGILPPVLDIKDSRLKAALKELKKFPDTCPHKGVKRGAALLYTQDCIVFADYTDKNPVSGEFPLKKVKL